MKKHIGSILVGIALVIILLLNWITFTVRFQEKALVLTFGKISAVETTPGLKWIWPWQEVIKFDCRIRTYSPVAYQIQTKDKQPLLCRLYVNWRISDPEKLYKRFSQSGMTSQADVVEAARIDGLDKWIPEAMNVFVEYDLNELVTLDKNKFKLETVEKGKDGSGGILGRIRKKESVMEGHGIEILDVGIRQLGVPDQVTQSVFDRMKKEREAVVTTLLADGKSQNASIVAEAKGQAIEIKAKAEAQAKAIIGQGDAQAAEYYKEFLAHPQLANFLRKLDTLRKTLNERTTIVLDNEMPAYKLLTDGPKGVEQKSSGTTAPKP